MSTYRKRGVVRPIARARPFDATIITVDPCGQGNAVFVESRSDGSRDVKQPYENGTFHMCRVLSKASDFETNWEGLVFRQLNEADVADEGIEGIGAYEDLTLIGFSITSGEVIKRKNGVVSARGDGANAIYVPITIAGAMTVERSEFFKLLALCVDWSLVRNQFDEATNSLRAGFQFRVHGKMIRVQEAVYVVETRAAIKLNRLAKSVTIIISTLS